MFLTTAGIACLAVSYIQQFCELHVVYRKYIPLLLILLYHLAYSNHLAVVTAMIGKLAVSGSFSFIYLYSAELFPTQIRNIGAGVVTIGARLGGFFSPIVLISVSR